MYANFPFSTCFQFPGSTTHFMNVNQQKEEQWQYNKGKVCERCSVVAAVTGQKELWNGLLNVSVTVV